MGSAGFPLVFTFKNRCVRHVRSDSSADAVIKAKAASADWQFHYKRMDALFARRHIKDMGMAQYVCVLCEWIYDEELGDPKRGIAPGTKFADLPDDWECPECFAGKDEFELIEFGD